MMNAPLKREDRVRRLGQVLRKSRARRWNVDNHGRYMVVDAYTNRIEAGERFDLDLAVIEGWYLGL